jgi:hypothetical protein
VSYRFNVLAVIRRCNDHNFGHAWLHYVNWSNPSSDSQYLCWRRVPTPHEPITVSASPGLCCSWWRTTCCNNRVLILISRNHLAAEPGHCRISCIVSIPSSFLLSSSFILPSFSFSLRAWSQRRLWVWWKRLHYYGLLTWTHHPRRRLWVWLSWHLPDLTTVQNLKEEERTNVLTAFCFVSSHLRICGFNIDTVHILWNMVQRG